MTSFSNSPVEIDLKKAEELYDRGKVPQAEAIYREVLKRNPDNLNALHSLGLIFIETRRPEQAADFFRRAIEIDGTRRAFHNNLGHALQDLGRLEAALESYENAIRRDPNYVSAFYNRGNAARALGRLDLALASYDKVIELSPNDAETFNNKGIVLADLSRVDEAIESYDEAIRRRGDFAEAYSNRGIALRWRGDLAGAIASYERAIALKPDHAEAHSNHGSALHASNRFEEALRSCDRAIALAPNYAEAYANRGAALDGLKRSGEALESYDRAIAIKPHFPTALYNRGLVLAERRRFEEALEDYDRALALEPNRSEAHSSRGVALGELMRFEEALECYERAIRIEPDHATAHANYGMTSLLLGDFGAGWKAYEWRKKSFEILGLKEYPQPSWSGDECIAGKTLLMQFEQGLGDTIQFCRFAKLAQARGAKVILSTQDAMTRLIQTLSPSIEVIASKTAPGTFDYHIALLSAPMAFNIDANCVPAETRYLHAEPALVEHWRRILGDSGFKIGIAWHGSRLGTEIGKSFPLRLLEGISNLPRVRLISLQKGEGTEQISELPDGMKVETLGDNFDSGPDAFLDTAAVMQNLDLIISSDTSIAHLAGALGRPTWIALKQIPDWRWLLDRDDSPWYPTVRLFRQQTMDNWTSVFDAMRREIAHIVDDRSSSLPTAQPSMGEANVGRNSTPSRPSGQADTSMSPGGSPAA
jgi:tetratricopeptide (TPR) repeat protein